MSQKDQNTVKELRVRMDMIFCQEMGKTRTIKKKKKSKNLKMNN